MFKGVEENVVYNSEDENIGFLDRGEKDYFSWY